MGKRSREKRTGLTLERRIQRSIKRKQKEEERKAKEAAELAKAMLGLPELESKGAIKEWEMPMPPGISLSPAMRQLIQLERERKKKTGG